MCEYTLKEPDYLASIQAALAIDAVVEVLDSLCGLAEIYIQEGLTQVAAEVLAFILFHPQTADDTFARAEELFKDLASRICPRVILDAEYFACQATLTQMVSYVFAEDE